MKPNHLAFPVAWQLNFQNLLNKELFKEFVKSSEKLSKQFIY